MLKKRVLAYLSLFLLVGGGSFGYFYTQILNPQKSVAYKRAKKLFDPNLYLLYRLTDRILEANQIKRPIRVAVRKGSFCDQSNPACAASQVLPDIDKSTNFDIWASQVVNTMVGNPNAGATSTSGTLFVNVPMLKELMGKPTQLSCVIAHELAHITQNHSEAEQKERLKYDMEAAQRISSRVKQLHANQNTGYMALAILGGMSAAYSGDNSSLNTISTQIQFDRIAAQMAAPEIGKVALNNTPVIGEAINQMKGLSPSYVKSAMASTDIYLRDATLKLKAFNRGQEYEADLLGLRYITKAGFSPQACLKLWTQTMPHDQDEIIARLLPDGTKDPGKEEVSIFINKEKKEENLSRSSCVGLKGKEKIKCKRKKNFCDPYEEDCEPYSNRGSNRKEKQVPEDIMELLRTHPSHEKRAKALKDELDNKKDVYSKFKQEGKEARKDIYMRDWSYDEDSNSVVISDILKLPKNVGIKDKGITGIDVDAFLD